MMIMSENSLSIERKELQKAGLLPPWFTTGGWQLFKEKYLYGTDKAFFGQIERISITAASHTPNPDYWQPKFFELLWKGWLSASTPILANMGTGRGYSVSCSGQYVDDDVHDFYEKLKETAMLSKGGFGTSGYFGDIRPRGSPISKGGKASGSLPVFEDYVTCCQKISQGGTRRGSFAGYFPIMHGDFDEVIDFVATKPDDVNIGWNIYDEDIKAFSKEGRAKNPEADRRRKKILKTKCTTGKGYLFFPDKVNRHRPKMYKDWGLEVKSSNLCTEITLFQDRDHTYTCVLSSMNVAKYDEWKDTDAVFTATVFLDCVAEDFIVNAKGIPGYERAVRFTEKGRALGLGQCGYHTYLQEHMIPFASMDAYYKNIEIAQHIKEQSLLASQWMGKEWGEPLWCKGYGVRNTHRTAIAPTMSTAQIMGGISQGIEPMLGNAFIQSGAAGEIERINPVFLKILKSKGKYSRKIIEDVAARNGSVQHLDCLTDEEKLVLLTAFEISQEAILRQASRRQRELCQAQSINLFISAEESEKNIARLHQIGILDEWIFSLYYLRAQSGIVSNLGCEMCQ